MPRIRMRHVSNELKPKGQEEDAPTLVVSLDALPLVAHQGRQTVLDQPVHSAGFKLIPHMTHTDTR